jgi:hypothetical protein
MSFYTHNKPRLVESNLYHKLLRKQHYSKLEQTIKNDNQEKNFIADNEFLNSIKDFLKNNWSFLLILSILVFILVYRYNVIKEDLEMKKARKQYIDQLIIDNYRKEKRLELERKNDLNEDWIDETLKEYQNPNNLQDFLETENIDQTEDFSNFTSNDNDQLPTQEVQAINQDSSFNNYFNSKMDNAFEPFYGNSSFAPF